MTDSEILLSSELNVIIDLMDKLIDLIIAFSTDFLGRTEIRVKDIYDESQTRKGPIVKRLSLQDVSSGEVIVKFDLQIFGQ